MVIKEYIRESWPKWRKTKDGTQRPVLEKMVLVYCDQCGMEHFRTLKHYNTMKKKFKEFDKDYCNKCWRSKLHARESYKENMSNSIRKMYNSDRGEEVKAKISSAIKGTKIGDDNPMRRPEVRAKVSKTRSKMMEDPQERQKYVQGSINAHARGVYHGIDTSGKCKWHEYQHSNGNTYKVQGTWELKFIEWLDDNNIDFTCHKGRLEYKDGEYTRNYYPDFYVPGLGGYVDVKSTYWYKKQKEKWKLLEDQYPGKIQVLTEYELRKLGVKI